MQTLKNLAIIPARGGSKGIPKKNLVLLNGKPLITYTIEAAIQSGKFDKICLTSDCDDILNFGSRFGIDAIKRPIEISNDNSKSIDAVLHVLEYYHKDNIDYKTVVLLQPTSPLRNNDHIIDALEMYYQSKEYNSLVSCNTIAEHPYKCFLINDGKKMSPLFGESYLSMPRQLLPNVISQNGAIYINKSQDLIHNKSFFTEPVIPFMMDNRYSIDIDSPEDLLLAKFYLDNNNS